MRYGLTAAAATALLLATQAYSQDQQIKVSEVNLRGITRPDQRTVINLARAYLRTAVNHQKFRNSLLGEGGEQRIRLSAAYFRERTGRMRAMCRREIWNIIQQGRERATPSNQIDREIDLHVVLVNKRRPVVGSTYLGHQPIRTGYWFVNSAAANNDAVSVARHLMHEWLHVAGFAHYPNNSARGDVPYALGELVRDILRDPSVRRQAIEAANAAGIGPRLDVNLYTLGENEVIAGMLDDAEDESDLFDEFYDGPAEPVELLNANCPEN